MGALSVILTCSTSLKILAPTAVNVCDGVPWLGWQTAIVEVRNAVVKMDSTTLVAYVDANTHENSFSIKDSMAAAWQQKNRTDTVLFSTQPFCYTFRHCTYEDYLFYYVSNPHWQGSRFLDAGAFIGTAGAVGRMTERVLEDPVGGYSAQLSFTRLYRRGLIDLDNDGTFFRTFATPMQWTYGQLLARPTTIFTANRASCFYGEAAGFPESLGATFFVPNQCAWTVPTWYVDRWCTLGAEAWTRRPLFLHFYSADLDLRGKIPGVVRQVANCLEQIALKQAEYKSL